MNIESQGMVLMAEREEKLTFIVPENEIENGSVVR
ncbi:MAG: hypothetical protein OEY51_11225 [Cyclobacteriaceae bacterium]|nr:hypothetical protein [Cyclobacteriaceae bacterium]